MAPDFIAFSRRLGVGMSMVSDSRANVREFLELFEVMESTLFEQLPLSCRERTSRSVDPHP